MIRVLRHVGVALMFLAIAASPLIAVAQVPAPPPPYGAPITFDQAQKAMAAAQAEAKKNNWNVVIAIVDRGGHLASLQRLDKTQHGTLDGPKRNAPTPMRY